MASKQQVHNVLDSWAVKAGPETLDIFTINAGELYKMIDLIKCRFTMSLKWLILITLSLSKGNK